MSSVTSTALPCFCAVSGIIAVRTRRAVRNSPVQGWAGGCAQSTVSASRLHRLPFSLPARARSPSRVRPGVDLAGPNGEDEMVSPGSNEKRNITWGRGGS